MIVEFKGAQYRYKSKPCIFFIRREAAWMNSTKTVANTVPSRCGCIASALIVSSYSLPDVVLRSRVSSFQAFLPSSNALLQIRHLLVRRLLIFWHSRPFVIRRVSRVSLDSVGHLQYSVRETSLTMLRATFLRLSIETVFTSRSNDSLYRFALAFASTFGVRCSATG